MTKRKRGQAKPFLGHPVTKREQQIVASLIGMTTLCVGISKRKIKSESQILDFLKDVYGFERDQNEGFIPELRRAWLILKKMTIAERRGYLERAGMKVVATPKAPPVRGDKLTKPNRPKKDEFYGSWEWRTLRMEVLKEHGRRCMCCGAAPGMETVGGKPIRICVDHIQPLSKRWDLRLVRSNLQVLCDECNQGKGAWDESDYRPDEFPEEPEMTPIEIQLGERLRVIPGGKVA